MLVVMSKLSCIVKDSSSRTQYLARVACTASSCTPISHCSTSHDLEIFAASGGNDFQVMRGVAVRACLVRHWKPCKGPDRSKWVPPLRRIVRYKRIVGVPASPHAILHHKFHICHIVVVLPHEVCLHQWPVLDLSFRQLGVLPLMNNFKLVHLLIRGEEVAEQLCTLVLVPKAGQHFWVNAGRLGSVLNRVSVKLLTGHWVSCRSGGHTTIKHNTDQNNRCVCVAFCVIMCYGHVLVNFLGMVGCVEPFITMG